MKESKNKIPEKNNLKNTKYDFTVFEYEIS